MRVCLYLAITLLLSLSAPPAVWADTNNEGSADNTEEARQRFQRGVVLFREGAFRAALVEFQRAYELKPHFALLSNIGQTQLELGDYVAASNALRGYLDVGGPDVPAERRAKIEKQLAGLEDRIAVVTINVNVDGAEVFIDGEPVGTTPLARGLAMNVGRHLVRVRSSDGDEDSKVLDVAGGDVRELNFELQKGSGVAVAPTAAPDTQPVGTAEPVQTARPVPRKLYRKIALGSFIGAGVLTAGAIAAIVLQKNQMDAYDKSLNTPDVDPNAVGVNRANALRGAVAVDVLSGLALVAAGAGVTFWFLGRPPKQDERTSAQLGISGSQLLLKGRF